MTPALIQQLLSSIKTNNFAEACDILLSHLRNTDNESMASVEAWSLFCQIISNSSLTGQKIIITELEGIEKLATEEYDSDGNGREDRFYLQLPTYYSDEDEEFVGFEEALENRKKKEDTIVATSYEVIAAALPEKNTASNQSGLSPELSQKILDKRLVYIISELANYPRLYEVVFNLELDGWGFKSQKIPTNLLGIRPANSPQVTKNLTCNIDKCLYENFLKKIQESSKVFERQAGYYLFQALCTHVKYADKKIDLSTRDLHLIALRRKIAIISGKWMPEDKYTAEIQEIEKTEQKLQGNHPCLCM